MNYIKHLTGFFNKINRETNVNPTHISLYLALFQCWNVNRFKNPTGISREEIMKASKINSKATYHKCMKELQSLGFMEYMPSFNPHSSSNIHMINLSEEIKQPTGSKNKPVHNLTETKNEQVIEQVSEQVYIYNKKQTSKNNLNNIKIDIEVNSKKEPVQNLNPLKNLEKMTKEKSCAKKENEDFDTSDLSSRAQPRDLVPTLEMAIEYFIFQNSSELEANKFFNYYSSIGWLIGGKTKMKDWKATARNWMLNTQKFNPKPNQPQSNHLHTLNSKNYAEPL